jgi:hypothetical protein
MMIPQGPQGVQLLDPALQKEFAGLRGDMQRILTILIAQQGQIEKLNQALATVRISRTQEMALKDAIKRRAKQVAERENMGNGAERRIAGAIRVTIRETTGARAIGDLAAGQYDRTLLMVGDWYMAGALRRIRREMEKHGA